MGSEGFGSVGHLAGRFVGALSPARPPPSDEAWALGWLGPGEATLWHRMSGPDQRHAVAVAREAVRLLDSEADRPVVAAALLHDVGKVTSNLGTFARVGVTVAAMAAGRDRIVEWAAAGAAAPRQRVGDYLVHDRIGAELLEAAGADPFTVRWAREHHLSEERWTVGLRLGRALKTADGD